MERTQQFAAFVQAESYTSEDAASLLWFWLEHTAQEQDALLSRLLLLSEHERHWYLLKLIGK